MRGMVFAALGRKTKQVYLSSCMVFLFRGSCALVFLLIQAGRRNTPMFRRACVIPGIYLHRILCW